MFDEVVEVDQLSLFRRDVPGDAGSWGGAAAAQIAGISYRQLDYWSHSKVVVPSIAPGRGSGHPRLYAFADVMLLRAAAVMIDAGLSLATTRATISALAQVPLERLLGLTVVCEAGEVFKVSDEADLAAVVGSGHGVVVVALNRIWVDVAARVRAQSPRDELAQRRSLRKAM